MRSLNSFIVHEVDHANVWFSIGKKLNKEIAECSHGVHFRSKMGTVKNMQQKLESSIHKSKTKVTEIFFQV